MSPFQDWHQYAPLCLTWHPQLSIGAGMPNAWNGVTGKVGKDDESKRLDTFTAYPLPSTTIGDPCKHLMRSSIELPCLDWKTLPPPLVHQTPSRSGRGRLSPTSVLNSKEAGRGTILLLRIAGQNPLLRIWMSTRYQVFQAWIAVPR